MRKILCLSYLCLARFLAVGVAVSVVGVVTSYGMMQKLLRSPLAPFLLTIVVVILALLGMALVDLAPSDLRLNG